MNMRDLVIQADLSYIDAITIVNNEGKIVHLSRYNARFEGEQFARELRSIENKNFFDIYPTIDPEESSILECLKTKKPVFRTNQTYYDYSGKIFTTHNVTIPILKRGELRGVIELSRDVTQIQELADEYSKLGTSQQPEATKNKSTLYTFEDILTTDPAMHENIERARRAAASSSNVLIYGETGTGKELFAQSIHNGSPRRNKPFIAQNCAALPESLFESLLFGTVSGAFTGAMDRPGLFEQVNGGTLFLDEINSLPVNLQAKLLRVLQDGKVKRIGDSKEKTFDVKVLTGMNVEPSVALQNGQLRQDLFYRISVVNLQLVPLRDRKEDLPLYISHFIAKYNHRMGKSVKGVTDKVSTIFFGHNWPGNVRELQHVIEGAINIVDSGFIDVRHLPIYLSEVPASISPESEPEGIRPFQEVIESIERRLILKALTQTKGNVKNAARLLEMPRQTLQYRIAKYQISFDDL